MLESESFEALGDGSNPMNRFELVIFDCDGVLVDSEKIAIHGVREGLKEECGLSLNLEDIHQLTKDIESFVQGSL